MSAYLNLDKPRKIRMCHSDKYGTFRGASLRMKRSGMKQSHQGIPIFLKGLLLPAFRMFHERSREILNMMF